MTTEPFRLRERPLLSRSTLNRGESLLDDPEQRAKLWPDGQLLFVDQTGRVPVRAGGTRLVYQPAVAVSDSPPDDVVLLGERDGVGHWALRFDRDGADGNLSVWRAFDPPSAEDREEWLDLRGVGGLLGEADVSVLTTAMAVLNWHHNAGFCAKCGSPTMIARAGWATRCTGCRREEYPRTDPAVICLVHDGIGGNGEHVLLARQPSWPKQRFSVLAGFVEAAETLEDCVIREVHEEVGVRVRDVRYLGNQPWPFPRSLMIGFTAVADRSAPLRLADGEIAEARWFSKDHVRAALASDVAVDGLGLPGSISIARAMADAWAQADQPTI
jgi:NAD+ diphosphatase